VSKIIGRLKYLSQEYPITLVGYNIWENFKNVDLSYYSNLELQYISPFNLDYDKPDVKQFLHKYHLYYNTEPYPYKYGFLAYDIMMYFGTALKRYGSDFPYCIARMNPDLLMSKFDFYRINATSGYDNFAGDLYQYNPNLQVIKQDNFQTIVDYYSKQTFDE